MARVRRTLGSGLAALAGLLTGCESFRGPGIEFTAPQVTGRVVADATGAPLRGVRVGRELHAWKEPQGGFWKGAEELRLLQSETRSSADGSFELRSERVALLFGFGDSGLNLRLTVRAGGFRAWQTNYPVKALATNAVPDEPRIDAGEIRLLKR